jgi:hypothetical protein
VPFYLLHPRLRRLERRFMREVEGGNANWLMRILRHEAGHAIDTAYRLRRRRRWREVFGPASLPYPRSYQPRPGSRRFVQHLGAWYAQSHPTEDFAETFAVWLKPGSRWRVEYADWPARAKLEFVDELLAEVTELTPSVRSRAHVEPLAEDRRTLAEHYLARVALHRAGARPREDARIARVFTREPRRVDTMRAATLLRQLRPRLRRRLSRQLGVSEYEVHQVLRRTIERCTALGLYVRGDARTAAARAERLVAALVTDFHRGTGPKVTV